MDFFKFDPGSDATLLQNGEIINNIERSMWVERYAEPGEFSFESKLSSGLKDFLPEGTIISHTDTLELMIVENHEIPENKEEDPSIIITGRSFISFLENRAVGVNQARASSTVNTYNLSSGYPCDQIVQMINDHILSPYSTDDSLTHVQALNAVTSELGEEVARTVTFGPLLDRVLEMLKIDDLGIKTVRANPFGVEGGATDTVIYVYRGINRSAYIIFSWDQGDLDVAQYLFSNKDNKTSAFVLGQYVCVMVDGTATKYNRRIMMVDGTDIDGNLGEMPTGATLTNVINAMTALGQLALANQNNLSIMQSDMSKNSRFEYRKDFHVGDLITVDGNFGQTEIFRIVEYAEIEDENGESGHPTLALPVVIGEEVVAAEATYTAGSDVVQISIGA